MTKYKVKPALCLDFDGTIRRSKSGATFIKDENDIELMPNIEAKIKEYVDKGYIILSISNQAGVAHGFKTVEQIETEMDATFDLFGKNPFSIVKWCYFDGKGTVEPFNHRSLCRKPDIGMLAVMEHEAFVNGIVIDWNNSLFVGDRPEDEQCAKNAGIKFKNIYEFLK